MKKHSEIIKSFGLSLLLLLLVSAVAVSEDAYEITVMIEESSSSEGGGDSNTVISTYDSETGVTKTTEISGSGTKVISPEDDVPTSEGDIITVDTTTVDTEPTEIPDSGGNEANGDPSPDGEMIDIPSDEQTYYDELVDEFLSMMDVDLSVVFDDFPELDSIAAFE